VKIDKTSPSHWLALGLSMLWVLVALLARAVTAKNTKEIICLYGHKLNGNLLALYEKLKSDEYAADYATYYLTMDDKYHKSLLKEGVNSILITSHKCVKALSKTNLIISDHGLHSLVLLLNLSDIKFVDVWHGIPFKGFDENDFKTQHKYEEIWVSSEKIKELYVKQFKFQEKRVISTGYGRTDYLCSVRDTDESRNELGLPKTKKIILYAPTWKQDLHARTLFPFDLSENEFLTLINQVCVNHNALCLFRTHINSKSLIQNSDTIKVFPHQQYPNTEKLLAASDILICDWSSIAFDYLALNRPTLFLDTPAPFSKGFSLGPEYRFGHIVENKGRLIYSIDNYLNNPKNYIDRYSKKQSEIATKIYDENLDGKSCERYVARIKHLSIT
jgi:CDP-ribitol ribitolphosphotransferase